MQYINPIEILDLLEFSDASTINSEVVKKAKRKLHAEIDLSDSGFFEYYGLLLTKSDCDRVIDELANRDFTEFYLYLLSNKMLNTFLVNGDSKVFKNFKQDSIFNLSEFKTFISHYFAEKFDKALLSAFENGNEIELKAILNTSSLIAQKDINLAYKSISSILQSRILEIDEITKDLKNGISGYVEDNIHETVSLVKTYFSAHLLHYLPEYFQSQILKVANSINFLSNAIWDTFDTTQVSTDLTEYLLTLDISGLDRPTFERNFEIISKRNLEKIEQLKNAPYLKKWSDILTLLGKYDNKIEDKSLSSASVYEKISKLFSVGELNSLSAFADDIRTQIAYSIRGISISMWNKHNDIKNAIASIKIALQIDVSSVDKRKFNEDLINLQNLEKKYKGILVCYFCDVNNPDDNSAILKTIYKETYRSYIPRKVEFSYNTVTIPRCKSCKEVHSKGSNQFSIYFFAFLVLGVIVGAITEESHFILGGIIGGVIGLIIGNMVQSNSVEKYGIKDGSNSYLKNHPILSERMKQGWTFSKPNA